MAAYILRRILLMVPTMFGIMLVCSSSCSSRPAGRSSALSPSCPGLTPAHIAHFRLAAATSEARGSSQGASRLDAANSKYRGAQGLDPEFIKRLEKQFGFDKPAYERFFLMLKNYALFDFGKSYFRDVSVIELIREKLPVSMSLGIWMTLIANLISIPLGIRKAVRDGSRFDVWTSGVIIVGYAIPGFLFAILLIVLFAGGSFLQTCSRCAA